MFKINDELLRDIVSYSGAYLKGVQYYKLNRVSKLQYDPNKNKFTGLVRGTYLYDVEVTFSKPGNYISSDCTCPANDRYYGCCKHVVAVLLDIKSKDERGIISNKKSELQAKEILEYFTNIKNDEEIPLNLEVTFELDEKDFREEGYKTQLSLRVGTDRLYIVKNIRDFLRSLYGNNPVSFGKNFTLNPKVHRFNKVDQKIIDLMYEMYEHEKLVDDEYYGKSSNLLFRGKYAQLSPITLNRFLTIVREGSFHEDDRIKFIIFGRIYNDFKVYEDELPIHFELDRSSKEMSLNLVFDKTSFPIVSDGKYFLTRKGICQIPEKQRRVIIPFYSIGEGNDSFKLTIPKLDEENFISGIYPTICEIGEVKISDSLKEEIYNPPFRSEIYFDKKEDQITARLQWLYGDISVNPFTPLKKKENEKRILIRDLAREKTVLDYFEQNEFKVRDGEAYLKDEDRIFRVINQGFKELQQISEIYYSEDFKSIEVKETSSFTGRIRLNTEEDLLEFHFDVEGIQDEELKNLFKSLRKKKKYFRLSEGGFIPLEDPSLLGLSELMERLDISEEDINDKIIRLPKFKALYFDELLKNKDLSFIKKNKGFKKFIDDVKEFEDLEFNPPAQVEHILRNYQLQGFRWLKVLTNYGLGGILADDMGLGKSLQILSYLLSEKDEKGMATALLIVPTSLVYNWLEEIEKFTPGLKAIAVVGSRSEREEILEKVHDYDIALTSYPLIRRDIDLYQTKSFQYCILDEAQYIKNPASQNAKSVKLIKAVNRFALTGTPIENSLMELWSIFDFVMPGYLSSHNKFKIGFEKPIIKDKDEKILKDLGRLISPFLLRRLKKQVLKELPEKMETKMVTDLTREQKKVYLAYLKEIKGELEEEIKRNGFQKSQMKILAGLTRLRQICCHPSLFIENYTGSSGKMELFQELIDSYLETEHRILLFSQFTGMLKLIRQKLDGLNIEYFYLDGSTPMVDRGEMVKKFNEGKGKLFLISLRAGGTGLNLTGADTVIHFDPWWNPAVEEQATDRVYRIGQKNKVQVIKLITKGTIEEKIFALQEKKKEMINAVIETGETMLSKITSEDLMEILDTILSGV